MSTLSTYCYGPLLLPIGNKKTLTTHDIVNLCNFLNSDIGFGPGFLFEPEPITEGGIKWKNWPGKTSDQYKTLRFHIFNRKGQWPFIPSSILHQWSEEEDKVIFHDLDLAKNGTFLKALDGAPQWTLDELKIFERGFNLIGLSFGVTGFSFE